MQPPFTLSDAAAERLFGRLKHDAAEWESLSSAPYHSQLPTREELSRLIETCFWASMMKEEGRPASFSIVFAPPDEDLSPLIFRRPLPFTQGQLVKLSAALPPDTASIGVWRSDQGAIEIWGVIEIALGDFKVKVFEPGHLLVSSQMATALVTGEMVQVIDNTRLESSLVTVAGGDDILKSLIVAIGRWFWLGYLKDVASVMRRHSRGGTLVVVKKDDDWAESFNRPITYAGVTTYEAARISIERYERERGDFSEYGKLPVYRLFSEALTRARESVRQALQFIGRLTAADGATIVTEDFELLVFGAKIVPLDAKSGPERIFIAEPFEESEVKEICLAEWGKGTRHRSAAQLIFDQHNAIALTASADGGVSLFHWDSERKEVSVITHLEYVIQ